MTVPSWYWQLPVQLSTSELLYQVQLRPRMGVWPGQPETTAVAWLLYFFGAFGGCATRVTYRKVQQAQLRRERRLMSQAVR